MALAFAQLDALGLLVLLTEYAIGRCELGHDQATSAQVADEAAEDCVSHPSHGSQDRRWGNGDAADGDAGGHGSPRCRWGDKACPFGKLRAGSELVDGGVRSTRAVRVVPELLHVSILLGGPNESPRREARA